MKGKTYIKLKLRTSDGTALALDKNPCSDEVSFAVYLLSIESKGELPGEATPEHRDFHEARKEYLKAAAAYCKSLDQVSK